MKLNISALIITILVMVSHTTLASASFLAEADSVASEPVSTDLEELVVTGKNAWIDGDKVVFMPTKKEKNLANSPASLVASMNIPLINVRGEEMTDYKGDTVTVYINGEEATDIDLQTFWPSEVTKVEYFSDPTDPRFNNKKAILNFVTPQYVVGGVTRVNGLQKWPWRGVYSAASKLAYKAMTYGIAIRGQFKDSQTPIAADNSYSNFWLDKKFYQQLNHISADTLLSKDDEFSIAANAVYRNDKVRLTHTAGIKFLHQPRQTYGRRTFGNPPYSILNSHGGRNIIMDSRRK
jgi:hypothetical protein